MPEFRIADWQYVCRMWLASGFSTRETGVSEKAVRECNHHEHYFFMLGYNQCMTTFGPFICNSAPFTVTCQGCHMIASRRVSAILDDACSRLREHKHRILILSFHWSFLIRGYKAVVSVVHIKYETRSHVFISDCDVTCAWEIGIFQIRTRFRWISGI